MPERFGIIGHPLAHSLSPLLHNLGFRRLGLDAVYEAWPVAPEELRRQMRQVRCEPIFGMSVTIPHKRAVMDHLDRVSERAQAVGAVNTVHWDDGMLCGDNTDVLGVVAPLRDLNPMPQTALVLGAGGAARAAVVGFREVGVPRVVVAHRTPDKAQALAEEFSVEAVDWDARTDCGADLVCNATPLGMDGALRDRSPWPADGFSGTGTAYDLVYNPLVTRFLREAETAGWRTISGLDMFLAQGLAQFRIWTGEDMDADAARQALAAALSS